jgi:hypothetical protein
MWFQKNNKLYKEFFCNFETFIGHFEPLSASSSFASVPSFTKDLKIAKGGQLSVADLEKQEGLLFPADKFISPVEPTNIHDVQIGEELLWETADKVGEAQVLSYWDEHLEAKLFPHLFPYGKGSWYWKKMLLLLGNITKCILCMLTEDGQMIGFIHFSLLIET